MREIKFFSKLLDRLNPERVKRGIREEKARERGDELVRLARQRSMAGQKPFVFEEAGGGYQ